MTTTVTFNLDAFERRMERQRVIEPSDVELPIEALRSERAARAAVEQERDQALGLAAFLRDAIITKNRIAAGACPCRSRAFQNLAGHMANKRPAYGAALQRWWQWWLQCGATGGPAPMFQTDERGRRDSGG